MKILRTTGMLIGVALAALLIRKVGWVPIRATLGLLGWKYVWVILFPISWILLNTVAWKQACRPGVCKLSLVRQAGIRLAGEAFNSLFPSSYVAGEPVKAKLLSGWMPLREATSSVIIAKSAQSVALVVFLGLGLTLAHTSGGSALEHRAPLVALGVLSTGIFTFTLLLSQRAFSRAGRLLHRLTGHPWLRSQELRLIALDESLGYFYRECKGRFFGSILWHAGGWLAGAMELGFVFFLLGHPIPWQQVWFMAALAVLGQISAFFVPAGVGLFEGGHYLAALLLGISPELALGVSLIRRVREIFWDLVGLALFWKFSKEVEKPAQVRAGTADSSPGNATATS